MVLATLISLLALLTSPVRAERPVTPQDWPKIYDACLEGVRIAAQQLKVGPAYAPTYCTCVRDNLKMVAQAEWNARFPVIDERCTQLAKNVSQFSRSNSNTAEWTTERLSRPRTECYQQPPATVPARSVGSFCTCYLDYLPKNVSWREWLLVDLAIKTKGLQNLDAQETSLLTKILTVTAYCAEKLASQ